MKSNSGLNGMRPEQPPLLDDELALRRIYMANQIAKNLSPDWDDLTPPKQWTEMNQWAVRAYNYYYGITHALEFLR
jgi:hypothetical protein